MDGKEENGRQKHRYNSNGTTIDTIGCAYAIVILDRKSSVKIINNGQTTNVNIR